MALPDAQLKVTFFFEFVGGSSPAGWTENFYFNGPFAQATLDNIWTTYVPVRVELLGNGARLESARLSLVTPPGQVSQRITLVRFAKPGEGVSKTYAPGTKENDTDPVQVDVLMRMQTTEGKRRQFWLAGVPDVSTDTQVAQGVAGNYTLSGAFKQWVTAVIKMPFLIRWRNNPGVLPKTFSGTQIVSAQVVQARNRKRGRPFDLYRGRRLV